MKGWHCVQHSDQYRVQHCVQGGTRTPDPHVSPSRRPEAPASFSAPEFNEVGDFPFPLSWETSDSTEVCELEPLGGEHSLPFDLLAVDQASLGYSIQVPVPRRKEICPRCDTLFLAAGPTGHEAGRPICDLCLLEGSHELGVLLALASTARIFGAFEAEDAEEYQQALREYGAFARIYEVIAARSGPPRLFPPVDLAGRS